MRIDKNNYEEYVLDFLEGNLSEELQVAFVLFLESHPEIKEELDGLEEAVLLPEELPVFDKSSLLKSELPWSSEELEQKLIAKLEGDCSIEEEKTLDQWIRSDENVARTWSYIQYTKLKGEEISFEEKEEVKIIESIDYNNPEHLIIGGLEGDLDASQKKKLSGLLANDKDLSEANKYVGLTVLKSNADVIFENKSQLKKALVVPMWKRAAYAASIAAAIVVMFLIYPSDQPSNGLAIDTNGIETDGLTKKVVQENDNSTDDQNQNKDNESLNPFQDQNSVPSYYTNDKDGDTSKDKQKERRRSNDNLTPMKKSFNYALASIEETPLKELNRAIDLKPLYPMELPLPDAIEKPVQYAGTTGKKQTYEGMWDFAQDKAKETLWGDKDYPQEDYALALADKTVDKVSEKTKIPVGFDKDKEDKTWSFNIGKMSVSHKKAQ